ncbi:MAG: aspartate aminotransferase family protein [Deinococcales bacterium]
MLWDTERLLALDLAHVLHPVTNLHRHAKTGALVLTKGDGIHVWDSTGKRYIDGFAGLWNINVGHGRAVLAEAAKTQMNTLAFAPNFFGLATPPSIELAAKLAQIVPGNINHFQFTSGGSESNETAIKIARYFWAIQGQAEKVKIISRQNAYHGIGGLTTTATGVPAYWKDFGPPAPGFLHVTSPNMYRSNPDNLPAEAFIAHLESELEAAIAREGANTIAAFLGEPTQGAGGVCPAPDGYWQMIRRVCSKHQILLIADEVITGFGRSGKMFGIQTYDYAPDMICLAKGITSGYIPLGAVGVTDAIYEQLIQPDRMFMHGFTYSGHPVACAVALENIAILEAENLPENARVRGEQLLLEMQVVRTHPNVGDIRAKGLMMLVEVVQDQETKTPFPALSIAGKLQAATRERGLIVRCGDNGIAIAPPLTISSKEVSEVVAIVQESIEETFRSAN